MGEHRCPWWLGYLLASPLRRLLQDPAEIVQPYVRPGMTVLEPGPGMGFFTLEIARQVGPSGHVIAVDVQPRMIAGLKRRLQKRGIEKRVDARVSSEDSLGLVDLQGTVDFTLAMAVVHEMPSPGWFFRQAAAATKPGGALLLAEPLGHVKPESFQAELDAAAQFGFTVLDRPAMKRVHAALLTKSAV